MLETPSVYFAEPLYLLLTFKCLLKLLFKYIFLYVDFKLYLPECLCHSCHTLVPVLVLGKEEALDNSCYGRTVFQSSAAVLLFTFY